MKTYEKKDKIFDKLNAPIVKINREEIIKKHNHDVPHPNLHDFHAIKWFRRRVDDKVFHRGINTMLPNNGKPYETPFSELEDIEKNKYKLKKYLETIQKSQSKYEGINIFPKYLYSELTLTKIKKLKEIFLEFDEDLSRKLEIDEMVEMFKKNNIPVQKNELIDLFFKGKDRKKLPAVPFLDFYQFMLFALNKESDQDFRNFMRKYKKMKEIYHNKEDEKDEDSGEMFLPMNFNLILDYFNNKKEEREGQDKIKKAMNLMDHVMRSDHFVDEDEEYSEASLLNTDRKFKIHEDINVVELMSEFEKLFHNKTNIDNTNNTNINFRKTHLTAAEQTSHRNEVKRNSISISSLPYILTMNKNNIKNSDIESNDSNSNKDNPISLHMTNYLLNKIKNQEVQKLTQKNYNKFKSIPLAVEETKKVISKNIRTRSESSVFSKFGTTYDETKNKFNSKLEKINNTKIDEKVFRKTSNFNSMLNGNNKIESDGELGLFTSKSKQKENGIFRQLNSLDVKTDNNNGMLSNINRGGKDYIPLDFLNELYIKNNNFSSKLSK